MYLTEILFDCGEQHKIHSVLNELKKAIPKAINNIPNNYNFDEHDERMWVDFTQGHYSYGVNIEFNTAGTNWSREHATKRNCLLTNSKQELFKAVVETAKKHEMLDMVNLPHNSGGNPLLLIL